MKITNLNKVSLFLKVLEYLDDQLLGKKKRPKKKKEKISETKTDKERGTATVLVRLFAC